MTNPSQAPGGEGLPELPKSRACLWVNDSPSHCSQLRPAPNVVNAFPWPADSQTPEDRAYWREKGFWQEPLFTADQMHAYARAALDQQPAASLERMSPLPPSAAEWCAAPPIPCAFSRDWAIGWDACRNWCLSEAIRPTAPGANTPAAPDGRSAVAASPDVAKMVEEAKLYVNELANADIDSEQCHEAAWQSAIMTIDALGAAATQPTPEQYLRAHAYLREREADLGAGELDELLAIFATRSSA